MEIMLGVFYDSPFFPMRNEYGWIDYPFRSLLTPEEYERFDLFGIVRLAAEKADKINFLLDRLWLPLDAENSTTCAELQIIISSPHLEKTQFWINRQKVKTEHVLKLIEKVKNNKLTFNDIKFEEDYPLYTLGVVDGL